MDFWTALAVAFLAMYAVAALSLHIHWRRWKPTARNINRLPRPVQDYIHEIITAPPHPKLHEAFHAMNLIETLMSESHPGVSLAIRSYVSEEGRCCVVPWDDHRTYSGHTFLEALTKANDARLERIAARTTK